MSFALDPSGAASEIFRDAVRGVVERPAFEGARFGIAIHDVDLRRPVYEYNAHDIFAAASTTKIPTVAFALALLGPDFRFRTRLTRQGELDSAGTLSGDLVWVASGDPNLSGRVGLEGKLDFQNIDHSLWLPNVKLVERSPTLIIDAFARGVREAGIRRITGTVLVDNHLFGEHLEPGTGTMVSPIAVNDNLIDVMVTAGEGVGDKLSYRVLPQSGYVRFVDHATTGEHGSVPTLKFSRECRQPDGRWSVTITGTVPAKSAYLTRFAVESPSRFARTLLIEALSANGVVVEGGLSGAHVTEALAPADGPVVFQHVSPPLTEVAKVILKVSQNLHAEMLIPVIGATLCGARGARATTAGYMSARELLVRWGIDTVGLCQADAHGSSGFFSPDFMCRLLVRVASSDFADSFIASLPVMGLDGTLWNTQPQSPAAKNVRAKTGTISYRDCLCGGTLFSSKALAGYVDTSSRRRMAFTVYLANFNRVASSDLDPGQVLGELASAIYEYC